ncbi:MAG: thioredoxin [Saprospiraceae bacterium]|nr:thioredoxin [Saprospiraceae bacterium]
MNFQNDVLLASHDKPVVVDFWAEWCGPCRMLGPTIEAMAREQANQWTLVKVDTEEYQDLAIEYGVRGIPNVKMFYKGQVVAEFSGALPRPAIQKWLDENLPTPAKEAITEILALDGDFPNHEVIDHLETFLKENPDNLTARTMLAKHLVMVEPDAAYELLEAVKEGSEEYDDAQDIRTVGEFMAFEPTTPSPASEALVKAQDYLLHQNPEKGIQEIIQAVMYDKKLADDLPRRSAIAFFHLWGQQHPLTKKYRRQFDMVLY